MIFSHIQSVGVPDVAKRAKVYSHVRPAEFARTSTIDEACMLLLR